jgi:hypothetical protein
MTKKEKPQIGQVDKSPCNFLFNTSTSKTSVHDANIQEIWGVTLKEGDYRIG